MVVFVVICADCGGLSNYAEVVMVAFAVKVLIVVVIWMTKSWTCMTK